MLRLAIFLPTLLLACLPTAPALAIHKCEINGKITYSDTPCPAGKASELAIKQTVTPEDTARARARLAQDQQQLATLEEAQRQQAAIEQKQGRERAKLAAADKRRCDALAQQLAWLTDDAARAGPAGLDKARRAQRRADEKYTTQCR